MSGKSHNKKRNSLLLYEFLVRTISNSLVEGDKKKSSDALKILRRYYKPGTSLYKEFRLMNSLVKTTVSSEHVAATILKEARVVVGSIDTDSLDREKSLLIKSINHILNEDNFYDQQVPEYRIFATIQQLLNEWRSNDKDIGKLASYEDQLMHALTTPKEQAQEHMITEDTTGTARLLMKVMTKKLNEKYQNILSEQQRSLVKAYALSSATDDPTTVRLKLTEIREGLLPLVEESLLSEGHGKYLGTKLTEVREALKDENVEMIDDSTITRFMLYSRLQSELESKE